MNDTSGNQLRTPTDFFGTKELLQLVVKKLSSQALLFGLAIIVILVVTWQLFGNQGLPIVAAILFVFVVATAGYLFFEQKRRAERGDPQTMSELLGEKINAIGNSSGDFSVQVWTAPVSTAVGSRDIGVVPPTTKPAYRIGEKIIVHFRATRDCYLTLLNIGTSGKLTILFPNALHRDNLILANRRYEIPGPEYGFEYELQGPPGVEKLKAIATLEKVDLLESQFAPNGSLFRTVAPTAGARDIAVIQKKVEAIPIREWAEASLEFRVSQ